MNDSPPFLLGELEAQSRKYTNAIVLVLPLSDGQFAIFGNDRILDRILPEAPTSDELRAMSKRFFRNMRRTPELLAAEGKFYGEPSPRQLARDLRRAHDEKKVEVLEW